MCANNVKVLFRGHTQITHIATLAALSVSLNKLLKFSYIISVLLSGYLPVLKLTNT